jgi:ABC-2 type transport system ATP-binding protein
MMIEVENLCKYYPETRAVDGLTFHVGEGEIFGFIGPNGAGKTTTIRILATLIEPTGGSVRIGGLDVINQPEKVRSIVGFMPDYYGVYENVRVLEFLDFFAAAYKIPSSERKSIITDVMRLVDMESLASRMVSQLSKGMKQRLCLAKTLLHDPKVLVLDEPASGLDPWARIELRVLLKELAAMGKTIFLSSHILTELSDVVSSVGIIEKGRLLAFGPMDRIAGHLTAAIRLEVQVAGRDAEAQEILTKHELALGVSRCGAGKFSVDFKGTREEIRLIIKALVDAEIPVTGLIEHTENLEDIFMRVTRGELG